jgi:peptide/nickel transport system permease protein
MATVTPNVEADLVAAPPDTGRRFVQAIRRGRLDWKLLLGLLLILGLIVFGLIGRYLVDEDGMRLGSAPFSKAPSDDHPFGTDSAGRDLFTLVARGTLPTLAIGVIAGAVGTAIGAILGLVAGYYHGPVDTVIRILSDMMLAIPTLLVMVVVASFITTGITTMALIIAVFSWPWAARTVRGQALSLRERSFVEMAKLSGSSGWEVLLQELLPNLLPYIMSGFVGAVSGGILAAVGLQLLGLGPLDTPTLGLLLNNAFQYAALYRGMWWWWLPPTALLAILFIGLFLISLALDEIANPRLKTEG